MNRDEPLSNGAFIINLRRCIKDVSANLAGNGVTRAGALTRGRAVQVDPIKPELKPRLVSALETKI